MTDLAPDIAAIRRDLAFFTERWRDLESPAKFELRAIGEGTGAQSGFFKPDDLDAAAEWAASLNSLGRNLYMTRNPLRYDIHEAAKDADVIAALFAWADCDDAASVANIRSYGGPGHSATVLTGKVPSLRAHTYWALEEPCLNLNAWSAVQRGIAARFASDRTVVNPARILRLSGTVSWPSKKKIERGYVPELVGLRTEYDEDRDPIPFETLRSEFPEATASTPTSTRSAGGKTALDRAMATAAIRTGENWHNNIIRLVASYVSRGLGDEEIHAITDGFTASGYSVEDTRKEVQAAIDGARRRIAKGEWGQKRGARPTGRARSQPGPDTNPERSPAGPTEDNPGVDQDEDEREKAIQDCVDFALNDFGNGQRLRRHFGDDLLFVPRRGWFCWNDVRWAPDEDELLVRAAAHKVAPLILAEADRMPISEPQQAVLDAEEMGRDRREQLARKGRKRSEEETDELAALTKVEREADAIRDLKENQRKTRRRHAKNAGNSGPIANMLGEAKPYLYRSIDDLDGDPLLVNCSNGTLKFTLKPKGEEPGDDAAASVELRPHNRADVISKLIVADHDANAECPVFLTFLKRIQPEQAMRAFLQRWFGYTLLGLTNEQKLVFFYGGGRNGKSTLVDVIAKLMGDYATTVPIETLTGSDQRSGADATPDLVRLPGARMLRASEPEEGTKLKEAMIKAITGGEAILIRRMREEFIEVVPVFKLTIQGNHKPNVRGTDEGIWRRLLLVPFDQQIPKDQIDPTLPSKLWAERAGILNWLIDGALEFLEIGLAEPNSVLEATAEFREDSDPVRQFLDAWCEVTGKDDDCESAKEMALAVRAFQSENGYPEWGSSRIGKDLTGKSDGGYRTPEGLTFGRKKASTWFYTGIRLTQAAKLKLDEAEHKKPNKTGGF